MKKNSLRLLRFTATTAAAVAVLCTAGTTLAMSATDSRSSGSLTTANLELSARVENVRAYSAAPASETANPSEIFYDEYENAYEFAAGIASGGKIDFSGHDGSVSVSDKSITVEKFTPGDKVEFDIAVTSASTISFNYRAELYVDKTAGQTLLNNLEFSAGGLGLTRTDISDEDAITDGDFASAVITDYTEWTTVGANTAEVASIHVSVYFPITAKTGQAETVKFYYVARGIQNTVEQKDVAELTTADGKVISFKKLAEAVEYAQNYSVNEIRIVGSTVLEEGAIEITNALKFKGVADENGNYPVLKGARFLVRNGTAVTFDKVVFGGESYIDVTGAMALTLTDCNAFVNPVKLYDESTHSYLSDAAFIVSGETLTPVKLTLTRNVIAGSAAAIAMRAQLSSGSSLSGNTFGAENSAMDGTAAIVLNGGYDINGEVPVIKADGNTLYADCALQLGGSEAYLLISENNIAYGLKAGAFVSGSAYAAFADSGSKHADAPLTCANIAANTLLFGGVDVTLNSVNRIVSGKVTVSAGTSMSEFYTKYVVGSTLERDVLALCRGDEIYAYLNTAENEVGYVVDVIGENE